MIKKTHKKSTESYVQLGSICHEELKACIYIEEKLGLLGPEFRESSPEAGRLKPGKQASCWGAVKERLSE